MKEIIFNNTQEIKEGLYLTYMTFGEYLDLINKKTITIPDIIDGYSRLNGIAELQASKYNNNEELTEVMGYNVDLISIKDKTQTKFESNKLSISTDNLELLDGISRTYTIAKLDKRFVNSLIIIRIHITSLDDARRYVHQANYPDGIGLDH